MPRSFLERTITCSQLTDFSDTRLPQQAVWQNCVVNRALVLASSTLDKIRQTVQCQSTPAAQEAIVWHTKFCSDYREVLLPLMTRILGLGHVERRWIEAIRRQSDLDHLTITQVVNRAFKTFFAEK